MSDYLNFDQAVELLNTTRSTLYKWLQAGRVPAHKLGRQWRFVKEELLDFRRQDAGSKNLQATLNELGRFFMNRDSRAGKDISMSSKTFSVAEIAEQIIWDAVEQNSSDVHVQPQQDGYQMYYRIRGEMLPVRTFDASTFDAVNNEWRMNSESIKTEDSRRMFLNRDLDGNRQELQVRYQNLRTLDGNRVVLRILKSHQVTIALDKICAEEESVNTLRRWCNAPHGLVLLSGKSGSGKTTTLYCCLQEILGSGNRAVFTIEDPIEYRIAGANQVEVDLDDPVKYKEAFSAIFASDLDVLFMGSSYTTEHLPLIYRTALEAAKTGHLVFLQIEAASPENAIAFVNKYVDENIEDYLVGASWQSLVATPSGKGRQAKHTFKNGKLST